MKFEIASGKEFKSVVDRAMAIIPKTTALSVILSIKITTGENCITVSAATIEQYVAITIPAFVIESGEAFVDVDDITRVYNLDGTITIEANNEKFIVKNTKKCCEVAAQDYKKEEIAFPMGDIPKMYEVTESEMVQSLLALDSMRYMEESRPIMTGFNIRGDLQRIAVCDGYRLAVKQIKGKFYDNKFNITIPSVVCPSMKKIARAKSDNALVIGYGKPNNSSVKYIKISGVDFTYWCRPLDGEFIDVEKIVSGLREDFRFQIDADEVCAITKEYYKFLKPTKYFDGLPMVIRKSANGICTAAVTKAYSTADRIVEDCDGIPDFIFMCNAKYIYEAANLFGGKRVNVIMEDKTRDGYCYGMMGFTDDEQEYKAYVLPVRPGSDTVATITKKAWELISKL